MTIGLVAYRYIIVYLKIILLIDLKHVASNVHSAKKKILSRSKIYRIPSLKNNNDHKLIITQSCGGANIYSYIHITLS